MCKAVCTEPRAAAAEEAQVTSETLPKAAETADEDVHTEVVRTVITTILHKLSSSSSNQGLEAVETATEDIKATDVESCPPSDLGLEVRWMASGNTACMVQTSPQMCVSEVKAQVQAQAQVPVEEQRLFSSGTELHCGGNVPELSDPPPLMLVRSVSDPRATDLSHFHCPATFESLSSASFTMVSRLNSGINGDIFKYKWAHGQDNTCVAVKKLRNSALVPNAETDERLVHMSSKFRFTSNEDALTEIGVLSHLSQQADLPVYLLKMLGVFSENKFTWLVTEFAEGGELFDVAAAGGLSEARVQEYMWQMLQAVEYLHRHYIGHRDISLENVLLKDDTVRLMDYGMAVRSHSNSGTPLRYFREVGKAFYRGPECYVPIRDDVPVTAPPCSSPGDVVMARVAPHFLCEVRLPKDMLPGSTCLADVWGYAALPADMFALAVCMFIMVYQCPPWEVAKLSNRLYAHVYNSQENGLESLLKTWNKQQVLSSEAMNMMSDMLEADPVKRPSADCCLNYSWFSAMAGRHVQLHTDDAEN